MNEHITSFKTDVTEVHYYEKNNLPFLFHPYMTKRKGTIFSVNKHLDLELLFITDGEMEIHLGNSIFYAKRGETVVVNPNVLHNIIPITNSVTYHCIITDSIFFERNGFPLDNVHIKELIDDPELFNQGDKIARLLSSQNTEYHIAKANIILLNIAINLFEKHSLAKTNTSSKDNIAIVEKAIEYINSNITQQIKIDSLASHTGYSKFYFCRTFREITGFTPTTYVNMQKIKFAHNMLLETDATVNDVSLHFGFKSVAYFSTTFKKYTGINPSDVKQKNRTKAVRLKDKSLKNHNFGA